MPDGPWAKYSGGQDGGAAGPWAKYQGGGNGGAVSDADIAKNVPVQSFGYEGPAQLSGHDLGEVGKGLLPFYDSIFGPPQDQEAEGYRTIGNTARDVGLMATPLKIPGLGTAAKTVGEVGSRLMPGAATKAAAGVAKAGEEVSSVGAPSDIETLGAKIKGDLAPRVQDQIVAKTKAAGDTRKLYGDYLSQPPEVAQAILNDAKENVLRIRAGMKGMTAGQNKVMKEAVQDLSRDPSMANIETTRKDLAAIARYGRPSDKIVSQADRDFAGQLSKALEQSIRARVPSGAKYIDDLHSMTELKEFPHLQIDPQQIFTKEGISKLTRLAGGDTKMVSDAAGEYAATQLKDKSAKEARDWLTKNDDWLNTVPSVKAQASKYVKGLEDATLTQSKVEQTRAAALKAAKPIGYMGLGALVGNRIGSAIREIIP